MKAFNDKTVYSLQVDANALGGFLEEPFGKAIPTLAPACLPAVGGFATARSGAFNLDEIVSCSSAYTLVTGREESPSGTISTLSTAVIEDLNILEVVTAKRIVAQIAVTLPKDDGRRRISFAGSRFEGLRLAGRECTPRMNAELQRVNDGNGEELPLVWESLASAGSQAQRKPGAPVLRYLVDGFEEQDVFGKRDPEGAPRYGHIVEIPGFGRIILGEVFVYAESVQLLSIRAELGCPVVGRVTGPCTSGGGGQGNRD